MTTRREFFKITLGAAAVAAVPLVVLEPFVPEVYGVGQALTALAEIKTVNDWLERKVWYRGDLDVWQVSGRARFVDTVWEYDELVEIEPDEQYLAYFNDVAKAAILKYQKSTT